MSAATASRRRAGSRRICTAARAGAGRRSSSGSRVLAAIVAASLARGADQRNPRRRPVRAVARSHPRPDRDRVARAGGVPRPRRLCRGHPGERRATPTRRSGSSSARPSRAVVGLATAPLLLRGSDLTRLMVTLGVSLMLGELANRNGWLTGGADGLNFSMGKVLGLFPIGFTGQRNAALYSFVVLFVLFAVARRLAPVAVRPGAGGDPREPAARRRARHRHQPAHRRDLYGFGGLRRRGRRAARPDDADRLARPVRLPPLGRRDADADHRRRRLSLRRPHRRRACSSSCATSSRPRRPEYWEFWIGALLVVLVLIGRERIRDFAARAASLLSLRPARGDAA